MTLCALSGLLFNIIMFLLLLLLAAYISASSNSNGKLKPPGHLKKLGSHRDPLGVTLIGKFSIPAVFYGHFVKPGKPLWMRSVLDSSDHPGLKNWTDTFFKKHYGDEMVKIETSKKENRKSNPKWVTFHQFLSLYKTEDIYMVHSLADKMEELVLIPANLQCGGFQRVLQEAVMWMGSGSTMSVLHYDELDNLMCLLDGQKDIVLIDKVYKHEVEADGFIHSGKYSLVNVAKVDLLKYPLLANVPWHEVHLDKGDCVFIPKGWYHQVNSKKYRHLAINLWFSHLFWFNSPNCSTDHKTHRPLEPVSKFRFATPNEVYRSKLLEKLHDKGIMIKDVFVESLDTSTEERRSQFFEAIDRFKDSVLSWSEMYEFDIDAAVVKFPDIFGLPGNFLANAKEKIILYEPIPTFDDDLNDDDDDSLDKLQGHREDVLLNDHANLDSVPMTDDPVVTDTPAEENEGIHHNRQSDVSEISNIPNDHEHTKYLYHSHTESEDHEEDKNYLYHSHTEAEDHEHTNYLYHSHTESDEKDEDLEVEKSVKKDEL